MRALVGLVTTVGLACASAGPRIATEPIDWNAADERWSVHLITADPDGDERVTRIWVATVDGVGVIRTGSTRWWKNLDRDPNCRLRVLGIDYPMQVEFVTQADDIARIDAAFLEKYGWQERLVTGSQPRDGEDYFMRLLPRR